MFGVYFVGGFLFGFCNHLLHHHLLHAGVGFVFDEVAGEDLAIFVVLGGRLFFFDAKGLNGFAGLAALADAGAAHSLALLIGVALLELTLATRLVVARLLARVVTTGAIAVGALLALLHGLLGLLLLLGHLLEILLDALHVLKGLLHVLLGLLHLLALLGVLLTAGLLLLGLLHGLGHLLGGLGEAVGLVLRVGLGLHLLQGLLHLLLLLRVGPLAVVHLLGNLLGGLL